jgi:hypothetical protein
MRIAITGASGLIGSALVPFLTAEGDDVERVTRPTSETSGSIVWDPDAGKLAPTAMEGFDAVIHLAGEGIANRRWSDEQKAKIHDSRAKGTQLLSDTLAKLRNKPKVFVCASAIGFYGNRGDEVMTEDSAAGEGFLAEVVKDWEAATEAARQAGIRVVNSRFGVVLSRHGGALRKMLRPFKLGVGGKVSKGRQYMSWIAIDDAIAALRFMLTTPALEGPVNVVAPNPVTNYEFTKTLGRVLWRPTVFPMPGFMARVMFGKMANELLLASTRVIPTKLQRAGFAFRFPTLEAALRQVLDKTQPKPEPAAV